MASVMRLSRIGKIAALSCFGGSLYLFRDDIKPYLRLKRTSVLKTEEPPRSSRQLEPIPDLPEKVPYLLIGAGAASHSAMRAIRGHDPSARVLMIGAENYRPYMRPALSKELWSSDRQIRKDLKFRWWNGKEKSIFFELDEFYLPIESMMSREHGGVSLIKSTRLTHLDPENHTAYLENGQSIKYDKCLLAPGGKPRSLPQLDSLPEQLKDRVLYFRTADDFLKLEEISSTAQSILVLGGGYLGSELTCALVKNADRKKDQIVYQVYPESGNLGKVLPRFLSDWLANKISSEGAHVIPNVDLSSIRPTNNDSIEIDLSSGQTISADYIICAVGLEPDVELAKASNLEVDEKTGGYLVNSELEARTDVWVAGDASCFYDIKLGRRRIEHHDHAINSGKLAGSNMYAAGKPYVHQSMFWSDLGSDISFEAVGIIDSSLQTVSVFCNEGLNSIQNRESGETNDDNQGHKIHNESSDKSEAGTADQVSTQDDRYGKGVIFYLKDDVIVGILLWNLFSRMTIARRILNSQKKYEDLSEVAKMFNMYLDD